MLEMAEVLPAAGHGARGLGASLAAVLALANALRNRSALLRRSQSLKLRGPTRGLSTFAVFVGTFLQPFSAFMEDLVVVNS